MKKSNVGDVCFRGPAGNVFEHCLINIHGVYLIFSHGRFHNMHLTSH